MALKSVLLPKLLKEPAATILYDTTVVPVVVITASDIPADVANALDASAGTYIADKLPVQPEVVSLYQLKDGLELPPLFVSVGI